MTEGGVGAGEEKRKELLMEAHYFLLRSLGAYCDTAARGSEEGHRRVGRWRFQCQSSRVRGAFSAGVLAPPGEAA